MICKPMGFAEMHIAAGHDLESEIRDNNNKENSTDDANADVESNKRLAEIPKFGGLSLVARLDTCVTRYGGRCELHE